jgi:long-chain acyl-CoA synthetase
LNTGDVGRVDDEPYFYIVDRTKDLIIRGCYNVYPREIEEVLYEHPAVAEAAVIGIPHDSLGEEVGAAVTLKKGESADPDELRDYVKARVAAYKYPRQNAAARPSIGRIMWRSSDAHCGDGQRRWSSRERESGIQ